MHIGLEIRIGKKGGGAAFNAISCTPTNLTATIAPDLNGAINANQADRISSIIL